MSRALYLATNLIFLGVVFALGYQGWLGELFLMGVLPICVLIVAFFMYGMTICTRLIFSKVEPKPITKELKLVSSICNWLVMLGLLGTVAGMLMALMNVSLDAVSSVDSARSMLVSFLLGAKVALYTTLVGGFSSFWLSIIYRIIVYTHV